jgi:hypothetical protein
VSILHKKGSVLLCNNYSGLSLLNHDNKALDFLQFRNTDFVPIDLLLMLLSFLKCVQAIREKRTRRCSNAYDKVRRAALWMDLSKKGVAEKSIQLFRALHDGSEARVRVNRELSKKHQYSPWAQNKVVLLRRHYTKV